MLPQPSSIFDTAADAVAGDASDAFSVFAIRHGPLADLRNDASRSLLSCWNAAPLALPAQTSHFGYVHAGPARIECASGAYTLGAGMVFCIEGAGRVSGPGCGIVVSCRGYRGMFQIGGPVEQTGRLAYIDGCTDTLLIPPVQKGDPCLNLLCFPPGVNQTAHTHPSARIGIVARGNGQCRLRDGCVPLTAGQAFIIHPEQLHAFSTGAEPMSVIAWHPDSDFGATHRDHPMINRTFIDGVSASGIDAIQTRRG